MLSNVNRESLAMIHLMACVVIVQVYEIDFH